MSQGIKGRIPSRQGFSQEGKHALHCAALGKGDGGRDGVVYRQYQNMRNSREDGAELVLRLGLDGDGGCASKESSWFLSVL